MRNLYSLKTSPVIDAENKGFGRNPLFRFEYGHHFIPDSYSIGVLVKYFPFEKIEHDGKILFVSETNLIRIFSPYKQGEFEIEYFYGNRGEYLESLKNIFHSGYKEGIDEFKDELGVSYDSSGLNEKIEILENYIIKLQEFLFFTGFAVPEAIEWLGYIQANIFKAVQECRILKPLLKEEPNSTPGKKASEKSNFIKEEFPLKEFEKIKIKGDPEKIFALWKLLLLDWNEVNYSISHNIKTDEELKLFLGFFFECSFFTVPTTSVDKKKLGELLIIERKGKNLILMDFLIHATHTMNNEERKEDSRKNIEEYCQIFWENIDGYQKRFAKGAKVMNSKITAKFKEVAKKLKKLNHHPIVEFTIQNLKEREVYKL